MKTSRIILSLGLILTMVSLLIGCGAKKSEEAVSSQEESKETEAPGNDEDSAEAEEESKTETPASQSSDDAITAVIDVKDYGTITVALDPSQAPETVDNFVNLARDGFYDGITFHRIMAGFMMQGGDPTGTGTGGSGKNIKGEFLQNGVNNTISHKRGAISMARSSDPDSASSQFFIVHEDSEFLDGQYAAFGNVTDGMDVVDAICNDAKPVDNNGTIPAENQPVINSITIE